MLADLDRVERRYDQAVKRARGADREAKEQIAVMEPVLAALREGRPARTAGIVPQHRPPLNPPPVMTAQQVPDGCNLPAAHAAHGNALSRQVPGTAAARGAP